MGSYPAKPVKVLSAPPHCHIVAAWNKWPITSVFSALLHALNIDADERSTHLWWHCMDTVWPLSWDYRQEIEPLSLPLKFGLVLWLSLASRRQWHASLETKPQEVLQPSALSGPYRLHLSKPEPAAGGCQLNTPVSSSQQPSSHQRCEWHHARYRLHSPDPRQAVSPLQILAKLNEPFACTCRTIQLTCRLVTGNKC